MRGHADAYPFPTLGAPLRIAIAIAAVLVVFLVDRLAEPLIDDGSKFLLLGTVVMASAWLAGTGAALGVTVAGAVLGATDGSLDSGSGAAVPMHLALFVVQGLVLTAVIAELRAARRASEEQARVAHAARGEVEAASRMKDDFLATVSHELRTPLNAVLGWVHLLRTGKLDQETSTRGLESIERNVRLQAQLTGDLLDVSKALTGALQMDGHPIALGDAVEQARASLEPAARAKGVTISSAISESPAVVLGDERRLRQIAWHLLSNAIKFTPGGGDVDVAVETTRREALLRVSDSGQGIDPTFLPRVFDRFTQADPSVTRTAGGLGVGLALVRELVQLHGGDIRAENRPGSAGAVFTVRLPLQPGHLLRPSAPRPTVVPPAAPLAALDGIKVIVLDEDPEGRELVRTLLHQQGALVRLVGTVSDALESLEAWNPDVLITDSGSPEHASYFLVARIPSLDAERGGRIPALALTSVARSDQRLGQLLAGMQRELPKPVEPDALMSEVARLTGRERRRARR